MEIQIVILEHAKNLDLPVHATIGSAGIDLYAAIDGQIFLSPLKRDLIPTGISLAIPSGYEAQIRPRSGLALKHGITVLNSPGTIDSDYRGEVKIILINLGDVPFVISRGDRIAQMIVSKYETVNLIPVQSHEETNRGNKGFGSSGTK